MFSKLYSECHIIEYVTRRTTESIRVSMLVLPTLYHLHLSFLSSMGFPLPPKKMHHTT